MTTHQRIIDAFNEKHYLTSADLVSVAGYRYSARLHELRGQGYQFSWKFKTDINNKATNTTLYIMRKPEQGMEI